MHPAERPNYAWAQLMPRSFGIDVLVDRRSNQGSGRPAALIKFQRDPP
jgi:hypothetical protein